MDQVSEITIELTPAPKWGKTAQEATLTCPHGRGCWTVFGTLEEQMRMASEMAPALRSHTRCQCEVPAS